MKRKIMYGLMAGFTLFILLGVNECDNADTRKMYDKEQNHTVANQERLNSAQPPVEVKWSQERENINKRNQMLNVQNKTFYFYPISMGHIMGFYVCKGKISNVNSQVTNTQQIIGKAGGSHVVPSPSEDGSYGSNGEAMFGWTTDGTYFEWRGDYWISDRPLKLTQPVEQIRTIQ